MCFTPKIPPAPKPPMPEDIASAGLREKQRRAGALGFGQTVGTLLGSPDAPATTSPKTLLGA